MESKSEIAMADLVNSPNSRTRPMQISDADVKIAATEFLSHKGENPYRVTRRGAELWEDYAPAMRAALSALSLPVQPVAWPDIDTLDTTAIASPSGETIQSAMGERSEPASVTGEPPVDAGSPYLLQSDAQKNLPGWFNFWGQVLTSKERIEATGVAKRAYAAGYEAALSLPVQPVACKRLTLPDGVEIGEFRPCIIVNDDMRITEAVFEDVQYKSVPVFDGIYHYMDKYLAVDDGRLVGFAVWMTRPATTPPVPPTKGPEDDLIAALEAAASPCGIASPSYNDCPNMKEVGGGMEGERYWCALCSKGYFLDYEDMK